VPKTNDNTGATAAGMTGIVEHGAPLNDGRVLSELDPERNLDGTLIEGEHPDHPNGEEREVPATSDPRPIERPDDEPAADDTDGDETPERAPEREEESSPGFSSAASTKKTVSTSGRNAGKGR
jgi:hypothetical protein